MKPSQTEDKELLSRCLAGDRDASEIFVQQYSSLVYWAVQNILVLKHIRFTEDDLHDLHNSVFLQLFEKQCKKLRQYRGDKGCTLATWIRTLTVRITLNYLRKKGVDSIEGRSVLIPLEELSDLREEKAGPWELLEKSEQHRMLRHGMQNLPPRERLFLKLHFDKGLSIPEAAETMEISVQNAYTIKHRAIQKLKSYVASVTKS
ncbi:RNA polymerase sigma factor [Desulfonema magnum]|uniref:RNA polymerase sigma factor, sigma-70 family n=1 Tax=Desulfonema magnum TaxID=45655 RepID=A0A975BG75_9BACT|nr:sigma-70 family RNA polymerase sigma factor [Desulfonema magnum]QTA84786.1 RNA polymerase sigma factor, sigma-70 family [Desulfonema magnum]